MVSIVFLLPLLTGITLILINKTNVKLISDY